MGSFLGILFCGGRGKRLGKITEYISKAFVPVYDRPVFMYPLAQLEASRQIDEIVILTNEENDAKLRRTGYRTVIQDDARVHDMLSGLAYIREVIGDERPAILMPCDNVSDIKVDHVVEMFHKEKPDIAISIRRVESEAKLREMGVFDPTTGSIEYRPVRPKSKWGIIAPYIVREGLRISGTESEILNRCRISCARYEGKWFDIGDVKSLIQSNRVLAYKLWVDEEESRDSAGRALNGKEKNSISRR